MRIAVVGSGISGLVASYLLQRRHEVTVFEANDYVGGHTNTVDVQLADETHAVDTGFIVFNERTYPNFCRLLDRLDVASQPTSMGFAVRCDETDLEYNGSSLNQLFAQRRNLFRPRFHRMWRDILRFNREAPALLTEDGDDSLTVGEYVDRHGYSPWFVEKYLVPMGSAIWSSPPTTFRRFPIRFVVEFYRNHGLLTVRDQPTWRVITGGSQRYVEELTEDFQHRIRLRTPVEFVHRHEDRVEVVSRNGEAKSEDFDHVVFACHSDQALRMLGEEATPVERELLGEFPYEPNVAILHTDISPLPRRRRAWAAWNYHIPAEPASRATLTYDMNILQSLRSKREFLVTLNEDHVIDDERVIDRFQYHHPIFRTGRAAAQSRHGEVIDVNRTSFCGAYWGNGFHEDGVNSALAVCRAFGEEL